MSPCVNNPQFFTHPPVKADFIGGFSGFAVEKPVDSVENSNGKTGKKMHIFNIM